MWLPPVLIPLGSDGQGLPVPQCTQILHTHTCVYIYRERGCTKTLWIWGTYAVGGGEWPLPSQCCTCYWAGCVWVWAALSCPHLELSFVDSRPSSVTPSQHLLHSPTHMHCSAVRGHPQPSLPVGQCFCGRPCFPGSPPPLDFPPVSPPPPGDPARSGLHCGIAPAPWLRLPSETYTHHVHHVDCKDANFIWDEEAWSVFIRRVWSLSGALKCVYRGSLKCF